MTDKFEQSFDSIVIKLLHTWLRLLSHCLLLSMLLFFLSDFFFRLIVKPTCWAFFHGTVQLGSKVFPLVRDQPNGEGGEGVTAVKTRKLTGANFKRF